ncbi:MAG: hypothetical protein ACRDWG_08140, partial [Actinomycetes bacterium]
MHHFVCGMLCGGTSERGRVTDYVSSTRQPPATSGCQAQIPVRAGQNRAAALQRLEAMLDLGLPGWR